jgi:predicted Zn-dependent protease with MMP-like domain
MNLTEKNAEIILKELVESDLESFTGSKIEKLTKLSPDEINDAVDYLEDIDILNVLYYDGITNYEFGYVGVTPNGLELYKRKFTEYNSKKQKLKSLYANAKLMGILIIISSFFLTFVLIHFFKIELNIINFCTILAAFSGIGLSLYVLYKKG